VISDDSRRNSDLFFYFKQSWNMPCKMNGIGLQCLLWTTFLVRSETNVEIRATPQNIWFLPNNEEINKTWGYRLMNPIPLISLIICPYLHSFSFLFITSFSLALQIFKSPCVFSRAILLCRERKYRTHFSSSLMPRYSCLVNRTLFKR